MGLKKLKMTLILLGFVLGLVAAVVIEALLAIIVIGRLIPKNKRSKKQVEGDSKSGNCQSWLASRRFLDFDLNKQGIVWVLEPERVPWILPEKPPKEKVKRRDFLAVSPVKKYAKIKGQSLVFKESDGSYISVQLKGCNIEAVSSTNTPSRKWAKKFPLLLESKNEVIYKGSKILYMYLETDWEKESWCKALRIASCDDSQKIEWFSKIQREFQNYLTLLKEGYPAFRKPAEGVGAQTTEKVPENKLDGVASKVQPFFKKLVKKASRTGSENKANCSSLACEEKKTAEKFRQATVPAKKASSEKVSKSLAEFFQTSSSGNLNRSSIDSDPDLDDMCPADEGTICLNLLASRLFFDARGNMDIKRSIQARIQKSLSNTRTPSYIGKIICTDLDAGNLPPYIHNVRVLPADMNELWAMEVDLEYSGGLLLEIETRLEIREQDIRQGMVVSSPVLHSKENDASDILEDIEDSRKHRTLSEGTVDDSQEKKNEDNSKPEGLKVSKSTATSNGVSKWKSIMNSIAKQVSEVPISLSLRVSSLRGTLKFRIKPPPSDQVWFSFTSMPDIDFKLESSVGSQKITNGHVALFLVNRFKAAIRETLVVPNCDSITIPWMVAEKNDWVPRNVAPFIWTKQEPSGDSTLKSDVPVSQSGELKKKTEAGKEGFGWDPRFKNSAKFAAQQERESAKALRQSVSFNDMPSSHGSNSLQDLKVSLLGNNDLLTISQMQGVETKDALLPVTSSMPDNDDDLKKKKTGKKSNKMLDLGKKMGEKIQEKKRTLGEKSKSFVDKLRS